MTTSNNLAVVTLIVIAGTMIQLGSNCLASPVEPDVVGLQREKRATLSEEAEKIIKQSQGIDTNNVGKLIELVERHHADGCLKRVICELSKEPQVHGPDGSKFAQALLKYRGDSNQKVRSYLEAMTSGAKAKSIKECAEHYKKCSHQLTEVITVGNRLLKVK